jgi:hypothetical protein
MKTKYGVVPRFLRINAVTRANREEMIARVRAAMTNSGAWIVDINLFSNVSACFNFEIPSNRAEQLRDALAAIDLHLTRESDDSLGSLLEGNNSAEAGSPVTDIAGSLQITFIHNEPDLRIEVPPIPG